MTDRSKQDAVAADNDKWSYRRMEEWRGEDRQHEHLHPWVAYREGLLHGCARGRAEERREVERRIYRLEQCAKDLHWMARRYADGRSTYATGMFNSITKVLLKLGIQLNATGDEIIWARDAMGRKFDGLTDEQATPGTPAARSGSETKDE